MQAAAADQVVVRFYIAALAVLRVVVPMREHDREARTHGALVFTASFLFRTVFNLSRGASTLIGSSICRIFPGR